MRCSDETVTSLECFSPFTDTRMTEHIPPMIMCIFVLVFFFSDKSAAFDVYYFRCYGVQMKPVARYHRFSATDCQSVVSSIEKVPDLLGRYEEDCNHNCRIHHSQGDKGQKVDRLVAPRLAEKRKKRTHDCSIHNP